ncbi:MAG: hypothetical protein V7L20_07920 [Nostoc sp.]
MLNEIITVYAIIDHLLKAIAHNEDCRTDMSDAEIKLLQLLSALRYTLTVTRIRLVAI